MPCRCSACSPLKKEIDSSDEDVPRMLRAWKANCAEVGEWEIDGALTLQVDGCIPRELSGLMDW